jgi:hypothetical protein
VKELSVMRAASVCQLVPLHGEHATVLAAVKDKPRVALKSAILDRRWAMAKHARRWGRMDGLGRTNGWDIGSAQPLSLLALEVLKEAPELAAGRVK